MDFTTIILAVTFIALAIKSYLEMKQANYAKEYTQLYESFLRDEDVDKQLEEYIEKENKQEFKNKARIVNVYKALKNNEDVDAAIDAIDLKEIMFKKGNFSDEMYCNSIDASVFLILSITKAYQVNNKEAADRLINKVNEYAEYLNKYIEYNTLISTYDCLFNNGDGEFFHKLLNGEYGGYVYNKRMVGLFKKIAACVLVYKNEAINDDDMYLVKDFAGHHIGRLMMTNLNMYDRYKPEEVIEENKEIENKEE